MIGDTHHPIPSVVCSAMEHGEPQLFVPAGLMVNVINGAIYAARKYHCQRRYPPDK
jgi:hypothetical protein